MNPRFLETFIQVADLGSFSQAAERLHTTQANVSARISTLEQELGVRLFVRGASKIYLTPQGMTALSPARELFKALTAFSGQFRDANTFQGTVRIGAADSVARTLLRQFIQDLKIGYPRITVELLVDSSRSLCQRLQDGHIHLAFLMGPVAGHDIVNLDLINLSCVWVASTKFELPDTPMDVTQLASYPIVTFPMDSIPYQTMRGYFRGDALQNIAFTTSNSIGTVLELVKWGMGVAVLPRVIVEEDIANNTLRIIDVKQPFPFMPFHTAYRETGDDPITGIIAKTACRSARKYCANQNPADAW